MTEREKEEVKRILRWAFLLVTLAVVAVIFGRLTGCGAQTKTRTVTVPGPPTPAAPTCDGVELGTTKQEACENGTRTLVCTTAGFILAAETCHATTPTGTGTDTTPPVTCGPSATTFAAVQPILQRGCTSCHAGYATYATARSKVQEFVRRTGLPTSDPQHMPKGGNLTAPEKSVLAAWLADGLCAAPDVPAPPRQWSLDSLEQAATDDLLTKVAVNRRRTTRYMVSPSQEQADLTLYRAVAEKSINSVSGDRNIKRAEVVAPGLYRFDLEDFRLSAADWVRVENADLLNLESFTSRGLVLKALAGTRKPWLQSDVFADAALRNSPVYYALTHTAVTFNKLAADVGAQYQQDLQNFEANLAGFVGSPLSPHNRMISRHRATNGSLMVTYDTGALDAREKNYFEFPCLVDVGCQRNAKFVAGEVIYSLPNRLHGYALFNAVQGKVRRGGVDVNFSQLAARQDVAPVDVVRDFLNPNSSEIRAGNSCFRCHSGGMLAYRDQIRDHVVANGSEFGTDKDFILAIYKGNVTVSQGLSDDNAAYHNALAELQIDPAQPDPISVGADRLLGAWNLDLVAQRLLLFPEDFRVLVNQSANARAQVGQLLSGGTITFDQLVASLPVLIAELRLLQDPLVAASK